jgi:hypothetical protein
MDPSENEALVVFVRRACGTPNRGLTGSIPDATVAVDARSRFGKRRADRIATTGFGD